MTTVRSSACLPVVKFDGDDVSPEQRGEERDREVMQLVDGNLHWCLREHLCAHIVKNYTRRF